MSLGHQRVSGATHTRTRPLPWSGHATVKSLGRAALEEAGSSGTAGRRHCGEEE